MGTKKEREASMSLFGGKLPEMPEGYYSGDQPNPNLRAFVEQHMKEHPYDALHDDYDVPAFDHPIDTTKATAIYNMHRYWSKKPHDAIQQYIDHYTKRGDLVLDPFCGSGSTALAALREGRAAIAIDRSPAATFITKNYCTPVDPDELDQAFEELVQRVTPEIDWLYETRCEKCGGPARTLYTVYSQVFQCPECGEKIALFDCPETIIESHGKAKKVHICPFCKDRGKVVEINGRCAKFGTEPVLVNYECLNGCDPRRDQRVHDDPNPLKREYFERFDLAKIREIDSKSIPHWFPTAPFPGGTKTREPVAAGADTVDKMYTRRNLWALAAIFEQTRQHQLRDVLRFAFTGVSIPLSRMQQYSPDSGFPNMILAGTYYMPPICREIAVLPWFMGKAENLKKGYLHLDVATADVLISTQSAEELGGIPSCSVDYIFTDPPYADKVQYGELNFLWEAWLGFRPWLGEEIIVDRLRNKTLAEWSQRLEHAMGECFRVLRPGRWLSLCYHDSTGETWELVQDLMARVGFVVESERQTLYFDTPQKSFNQLTTDNITKRDLIVNFRKPRPGETAAEVRVAETDSGETLNDKVRAIIVDYLTDHPGTTKDRVWDAVVSRMVREGQMQPHDFEALLRDVANEVAEPIKKDVFANEPPDTFETHVMGRWYLKSTAYAVEDEAERSKENVAGAVMGAFIERFLRDHPEQDGVHYSDVFEHYLTHVTDKPRRRLAEWLPDYFFFTPDGTWRLPATPDEEELKTHERQQGTGRRIRRYLAYLQHHTAIPEAERPTDVTLADWIRHCKRAGMYEQGRQLYEQGGLVLDHLSEELQVDVQEDYGVCIRKLAEQQVVPQRHKKAKEDADGLF